MAIALVGVLLAAVIFFLRVLAALALEVSRMPASALVHLAKYIPGRKQMGVLIEMNIREMNLGAHRQKIPVGTRERQAL